LLMTYEELLVAEGRQHETAPSIEQLLHNTSDDPLARETLRQAGRLLGVGLANIANLLNPACIILTGEGVEFGDRLFNPANEALQEYIFSEFGRSLQVIREPWLGYESWARGAGALVLRRFFFAISN
ncbi:MAG TPA: ROK family protein, partial [Ktedonobacteraceae bacterium]|nr:ROK family protein [Ktedonobacteraceae bacterium]